MCIVTITLPVQSQVNERSCVLLPLHYLYKVRTMSRHVYCYHYTTCTKPGTMSRHVYCYHYTTCTKPEQWAIICIVTITLPVQSQVLCNVTITLPVQSQNNERSYVQSQDNEPSCGLLPLHYLYKARTMSGLYR